MRVLIVEDQERLRTWLRKGLEEAEFVVDATGDGKEGLWYAQSNPYDVIILDLMLPGLDGLSILRRLREAGSQTQVLILTAKDTVPDRVKGLDLGADDYLVKPFAFEELLARVRVLVRRGSDVVKALALGAAAVLLGRPWVYGLAAAGPLGVAHTLKLLREELEVTMAMAGCATLADINADLLFSHHTRTQP